MKKNQNSDFSDLLKMGEMAFSVLLGAGSALGAKAAESRDTIVRKLDLVTREEFDVAFAMIKKARTIQVDLDARVARLEKELKLSTPRAASPKKQIRKKK